ncbi:MAG TPA: hypothetical protein VJN18_13545 [Polyangiaceae bacterium]|nr:hypothetical protein [Polyangiaceae bacterium]
MFKRGILLALLACSLLPEAHAAEAGPTTKAAATETKTLPGGAVLTFSADAKYDVGRPIKLQLAPTGSDKTTVQMIKLSAGRVSVSIPEAKHPKTAVLIQAPRKVSAVAKGGQSSVIIGAERVTVAALTGEMLAALGNDWKSLPSGIVRSFGAGATSEQAVPPTPRLSLPRSMHLALRGKATTSVHAASSANVDHKRLWLYRVEGTKRTKLLEVEWRSDTESLPPLAPGRYELQARAVDRFGVESPISAPLSLRVIGADLPEGTRLSGETILLGRSTRVKLIGAEGLEATLGRASLFVPAPADIGLTRGQSTLLRLREQGAKEELSIQLEPRTLRAEIAIGPKTARWPGDPLHVSVKLFDHRGKPVSDPLKSKPRVFVNVDPVTPNWSHSGNTYSAKVPPASGSGPWVVRVEVSDDFGDEVGRNFIELGESSRRTARN